MTPSISTIRWVAAWVAGTILIVCGAVGFFQNRCSDCHAKDSSKGGFSIEPLLERGAILDGGRFRAYEKAFHQVAKGKMPPAPDGPPMTFLDEFATPLPGL